MSDFNSSLPVRTELPGDIIAKIADATTPSQQLAVDASGRITTKMQDGAGNAVTSQVNGAQRALDVGINVAGVQVDPRAIRALTSADVVTASQGSASNAAGGWFVRPTDGTNSQAYLSTGEAKVSVTQPLPTGTNTIGKVDQGLAGASAWLVTNAANGSATGGTAGTQSLLAGGIYNSSLPTLTTGQQSSFQFDSSGRLIIAPLTNTSVVKSQLQDNAGNGLTSAVAGSTRPLDVALRDSAGALYSATNPLPVQVSAGTPGAEVHDYNTASALAAAATSNHDYTITATKTFKAEKFWATASGKLKIEVQVSTNGTVFVTKFVAFNSTSSPNIDIFLGQFTLTDVGTGSKIRIIRTNLDKSAMDVYSTISGVEV